MYTERCVIVLAKHLNMLVCTYMCECTEVMFLMLNVFCMKDRIEELSVPNKQHFSMWDP